MNRRHFLKGLSAFPVVQLAGGISQFTLSEAWAQTPQAKSGKKVVFIFQRGGCDTLSMIHPLRDPDYNNTLRPNIYIPTDQSIKLDSDFGMNPALLSLKEFWDRGQFNFIHQTGLPITTRSHFDAQDFLENGTVDSKSIEDGFFTRALRETVLNQKIPLKAIALQPNLPRSLFGETHSLAVKSLNTFQVRSLDLQPQTGAGFEGFFESAMKETLNGQGSEVVKGSKTDTLSLLDAIKKVREAKIREENFPKNALANSLKDVAKLILTDFPAPLYVTEMGGWDTHVNQGNEKGQLSKKLKDFSDSIAAFLKELGPKIKDVTVVTVTEFGRTVKENGNGGTDHGHGCCYLVFGGQLRPKNHLTQWKDLKKENLYEERDVPVTTDARYILGEILTNQMQVKNMSNVFPGFKFDRRLKLFV